MKFINDCKYELLKLNPKSNLVFNEKIFFPIENLRNLSNIIYNLNYIDEILITPFYFTDEIRLEIYDYALMVRVEDTKRKQEEIILQITGKGSIFEVDSEILYKLKKTQYEVLKEDKLLFIQNLNQYVDFIQEKLEQLLVSSRTYLNKKEGGIFFEIS